MAGGRVRGSARDKLKKAPAPLARTSSTDSAGQLPRPQPQVPPRPVSQQVSPPQTPPQRSLPTPGPQGTLRRAESGNIPAAQAPEAVRPSATPVVEIWPLRLIDFDDDDQFNVIYALLRRYRIILFYLDVF